MQQPGQFGSGEFIPQRASRLVDIQPGRCQFRQPLARCSFPIFKLIRHNLVPQPNRTEQQFGGRTLFHQSVRIFGIEQEARDLFVPSMEIIMDQSQVEQHLHIMLLYMLVGQIFAFARLLLHQYPQIFLQQIHSSLQPQHLGQKRWFQHYFIHIQIADFRELVMDDPFQIIFLVFGLFMERRLHIRTDGQVQSIVPEELLHTFPIRDWILAMVNNLVQQLSGKVSQKDGLAIGRRLDLVHQIIQRGRPVILETGRDCRYVQKVIGFPNNQFGIINALLQTGTDKVQLRMVCQQIPDVTPIPEIVLVGVSNTHELRGFVRRLPVNKSIVPAIYHDTQVIGCQRGFPAGRCINRQ